MHERAPSAIPPEAREAGHDRHKSARRSVAISIWRSLVSPRSASSDQRGETASDRVLYHGEMIEVAPGVLIDENEIVWRFARSSGPGGQNVNKVATAVRLRFDVARAGGMPEPVRRRLLHLAGGRATGEGVILVEAGRFRSRERNKQEALERLLDLVRRAAVEPKSRRPTRPRRGAERRRLEQKAHRARLKKLRASPPTD